MILTPTDAAPTTRAALSIYTTGTPGLHENYTLILGFYIND